MAVDYHFFDLEVEDVEPVDVKIVVHFVTNQHQSSEDVILLDASVYWLERIFNRHEQIVRK